MANEITPSDDTEKNPGGRPLKYQTVEELDAAIKAYFDDCDPHWTYDFDWVLKRKKDGSLFKDKDGQSTHVWLKVRKFTEQKPYTMAGLAAALGIDRKTLRSYKQKPEFLPSIEAAKNRCESFWEGMLASPYSNGAKFNLTNNYDEWSDRHELDHTSKGEKISPYSDLTVEELRRLAQGS
jgi:hypothetical protein